MRNVLVYTVHKAASMFLHRLSTEVTNEFGIDYCSINQDKNFDLIKQSSWLDVIEDKERTGCFGPIRAGEAMPNIPKDLENYSTVLHLRDPRDVLVSLFFSHIYSHRNSGGFNHSDKWKKQLEEEGINKFVLDRTPEFQQYYQKFASELVGKENVVFIKYETMVSDYAAWLEQFLSAFSHLTIPPKRVLKIFRFQNSLDDIYQRLYRKHKNDFNTSSENIHKHIRQVTPGDHKRKLRPDTIERLNREFADVLNIFGYE